MSKNSDNDLQSSFKKLIDNKSQIDKDIATLIAVKNSKESELAKIKLQAKEEFGTDNIDELRTLYNNNHEHNSKVIPEALQQSYIDLDRIAEVKKRIGLN